MLKRLFFVFLCLIMLSGCAEMDIPDPVSVIKNPIGPNTVKLGMSKHQVLSLYGEPNFKDTVVSDGWVGEREEWFYRSRVNTLPVNADYLSKDLYLYFDGESLANISSVPLGKE